MTKSTEKLAHIFLYTGFVSGTVAVYLSRFNSQKQFIVVLLIIAFYLIWGFVYHHLKRDLTKPLMLEYLIIGLIALLTGIFIFFI